MIIIIIMSFIVSFVVRRRPRVIHVLMSMANQHRIVELLEPPSFKNDTLYPFPDEQLNLLDIVPKQVCHFSSFSIFCLGCKRSVS